MDKNNQNAPRNIFWLSLQRKYDFDSRFPDKTTSNAPRMFPKLKRTNRIYVYPPDSMWQNPRHHLPPALFIFTKLNAGAIIRFLFDKKIFFSSDFLISRVPHKLNDNPAILDLFGRRTSDQIPRLPKESALKVPKGFSERVEHIKSLVDICSTDWTKVKVAGSNEKSNQMSFAYEKFRLKNLGAIENLSLKMDMPFKNRAVIKFIFKFLLDILNEQDFDNLNSKEAFFILTFYANRYFRAAKFQLFVQIERLATFSKLFKFNETNYFPKRRDDKKIQNTHLEKEILNFSSKLWFRDSHDFAASRFFDDHFIQVFTSLNPDTFPRFASTCAVYLYRFICYFFLKIVADRFCRNKLVYDEIEYFGDRLLILVDQLLMLLEDLKQRLLSKGDTGGIAGIFGKLNEVFKFDESHMIHMLTRYLKQREMREYLQRKKKSKFTRPKRNDEKLKKIYKNVMQSMLNDFKRQMDESLEVHLFQNKASFLRLEQATTDQSKPESIQCASSQFKVMSANQKTLENVDAKGLANASERSKSRITSKEKKAFFYKYYFESVARKQKIPLDHFYDPLKAILKNTKFKSFTNKYFDLLLESNVFRKEIGDQLNNEQFLVEEVVNYPKVLGDLFRSVPTIVVEQVKSKAKFLWTVYEYYFAMFYFKKKFKI